MRACQAGAAPTIRLVPATLTRNAGTHLSFTKRKNRIPALAGMSEIWTLSPGLQLAAALAPIPPAVAIVALAADIDGIILKLRTGRHIGLSGCQIHLALRHRRRIGCGGGD